MSRALQVKKNKKITKLCWKISPKCPRVQHTPIRSERIDDSIKCFITNHAELKAGSKPSTWLPPGGPVERLQWTTTNNKRTRKAIRSQRKCTEHRRKFQFWWSKPSPFSKVWCHETACLLTYKFLVSQRRAVRTRQDQAMDHWSWSILTVFEINCFPESRSAKNNENASLVHAHSFRQLLLSRYYSSV